MSDNVDVLVVGAGKIAEEHIKVLLALNLSIEVIGRGKKNVKLLAKNFDGIKISHGGLERWIKLNKCPTNVIVATTIETLYENCVILIENGAKSILVEKPLTFCESELNTLNSICKKHSASVHIAYNRRFYDSVQKAKNLLYNDGGANSFHFDFTEALFRINKDRYSDKTMRRWGISNSSHVIDTAFFLAGSPHQMKCLLNGDKISWHPSGDKFFGSGKTKNGILFSYSADWTGPGRWSININSKNYKIILSPMEKLQIQNYGGFDIEEIPIDTLDLKFKPGFYLQIKTWLGLDKRLSDDLITLEKYSILLKSLNKIFGYG